MAINILVPMAGPSLYFSNEPEGYPKPLMQIAGRTMIEYVADYLRQIPGQNRFIFVVDEKEVRRFYLDNILKILFKDQVEVVVQRGKTKGAVCTALLAVSAIDNESPLVISNCDQIIGSQVDKALNFFQDKNADAGVITFESIHPKWSYVEVEDSEDPQSCKVVEVAEKKTISKNAIAGFYYFKTGSRFVRAAEKLIMKGATVNDLYFIAPTLNEVILDGGLVLRFSISNDLYNSFYNPSFLSDFEDKVKSGRIQTPRIQA